MILDRDEWEGVLAEQGISTVDREEFFAGDSPNQKVWVDSDWFAIFIGVWISASIVVLGLDVDFRREGSDETIWIVSENIFCVVWVFEMLVKLYYKGAAFFCSSSNWLDISLALLAVLDAWILPLASASKPSLLTSMHMARLFRVLRMLRFLRIVRFMRQFRELWLIVNGMIESLKPLAESSFLISMTIFAFAVYFTLVVGQDCEEFIDWQEECEELFGSMIRTSYTLFQVITLESWSMAIARPVIEKKVYFSLVFVVYVFLTNFGLLNIVVGVIVENTMNSAEANDALQKKRAEKQLVRELVTLKEVFEMADYDGSGLVDREEFLTLCGRADVHRVFRALDVPLNDPALVFHSVDREKEGILPIDSFIHGVMSLRNPPTNLELKALCKHVQNIQRIVGNALGPRRSMSEEALVASAEEPHPRNISASNLPLKKIHGHLSEDIAHQAASNLAKPLDVQPAWPSSVPQGGFGALAGARFYGPMLKLRLGSPDPGRGSAEHWFEREVWVTASGAVGYKSQRLQRGVLLFDGSVPPAMMVTSHPTNPTLPWLVVKLEAPSATLAKAWRPAYLRAPEPETLGCFLRAVHGGALDLADASPSGGGEVAGGLLDEHALTKKPPLDSAAQQQARVTSAFLGGAPAEARGFPLDQVDGGSQPPGEANRPGEGPPSQPEWYSFGPAAVLRRSNSLSSLSPLKRSDGSKLSDGARRGGVRPTGRSEDAALGLEEKAGFPDLPGGFPGEFAARRIESRVEALNEKLSVTGDRGKQTLELVLLSLAEALDRLERRLCPQHAPSTPGANTPLLLPPMEAGPQYLLPTGLRPNRALDGSEMDGFFSPQ